MSYSVYKHTFPNGKVYIGITSQKPEHRWGKDGSGYIRKNKKNKYNQPLIANAIIKFGWENTYHEILFTNLSKKEAEFKEIDLIAKYKSNQKKYGYNISSGGSVTNGMKGKHHSKETKQKIKNSNLGKKHLEKTIEKLSDIHKELWKDEDYRKHMSEAHKWQTGKNHPMYGKKISEEHRQKLIDNHWDSSGANNPKAKSIVQLTKDGNFIKIWDCMSDACRTFKLHTANVSRCCKHESGYKTAGGYKWIYYNEWLELQKK